MSIKEFFMKAMAFGSYMSNLTIAALIASFDFEQTHSVHHNRSDNFIRYYIDKTSQMIPESYFDELLVYKSESEYQAKQFLQNQYSSYIGFHDLLHKKDPNSTFFDDIKKQQLDVILMDNFMDIAARLMVHKDNETYANSPLFLNPGFYKNQAEIVSLFDWAGDYLEPEQSAKNWMVIYQWLRKYQPTARIFFLPYHYCTSVSSPARYERIRAFYPVLKKLAHDENIHIIPPLSPPFHLTKGEENWPHFDKPVYRGLAGYVYLNMIGGF
jgi:hypothetical protein